jgi:hypothetical protein
MRRARVQIVIRAAIADMQAAIADLPRGSTGQDAERVLAPILATMDSQLPRHARDYVRGYCARLLEIQFEHKESSL